MAGDAKRLQPIIVKKIKKGSHAAHGGAWKIAYADFVTAMMAFFLLMWLLGSTSEGDKKGIADYFQSPLKVALLNGMLEDLAAIQLSAVKIRDRILAFAEVDQPKLERDPGIVEIDATE